MARSLAIQHAEPRRSFGTAAYAARRETWEAAAGYSESDTELHTDGLQPLGRVLYL